jgi:hypothetical protein
MSAARRQSAQPESATSIAFRDPGRTALARRARASARSGATEGIPMRRSIVVAVAATAAALPALALVDEAKPQDRLPVFVRSAQSASGFTDPSKARQDSVKDLVKKLKDAKGMQAAESEAQAVILIEILDLETKRETNMWGQQNKSYLTVRVTAGQFVTEFTGESGSKGVMKGYGDAAGKIVKQLAPGTGSVYRGSWRPGSGRAPAPLVLQLANCHAAQPSRPQAPLRLRRCSTRSSSGSTQPASGPCSCTTARNCPAATAHPGD